MQGRFITLIGDSRIGLGDVLNVYAVVAEDGEGVIAGDPLIADTRRIGDLSDFFGAKMLLNVHIHGID